MRGYADLGGNDYGLPTVMNDNIITFYPFASGMKAYLWIEADIFKSRIVCATFTCVLLTTPFLDAVDFYWRTKIGNHIILS